MLTAVILDLQPVAEARLPVSHGSFVHAAAMDLLLRLDPLLSHTLHRAAERKPFTCSPLGGATRREGFNFLLEPEQLYTWRLTGLTAAVSQQLSRLSPQLGGIRIGEAVFSVAHVSTAGEQHPEAGQDTYEALLARWTRPTQQPLSTVTLHFLTPTTFRIGSLEQPFPLPHWVFGSLLATWNAFSPYPLPDLQEALDEAVALSNYTVETRRVELGGHRTVGFVGKCTYRVVKPSAEVGRLVGLLADFSFYAGVGWQTTHGLGQVRPQFSAAALS